MGTVERRVADVAVQLLDYKIEEPFEVLLSGIRRCGETTKSHVAGVNGLMKYEAAWCAARLALGGDGPWWRGGFGPDRVQLGPLLRAVQRAPHDLPGLPSVMRLVPGVRWDAEQGALVIREYEVRVSGKHREELFRVVRACSAPMGVRVADMTPGRRVQLSHAMYLLGVAEALPSEAHSVTGPLAAWLAPRVGAVRRFGSGLEAELELRGTRVLLEGDWGPSAALFAEWLGEFGIKVVQVSPGSQAKALAVRTPSFGSSYEVYCEVEMERSVRPWSLREATATCDDAEPLESVTTESSVSAQSVLWWSELVDEILAVAVGIRNPGFVGSVREWDKYAGCWSAISSGSHSQELPPCLVSPIAFVRHFRADSVGAQAPHRRIRVHTRGGKIGALMGDLPGTPRLAEVVRDAYRLRPGTLRRMAPTGGNIGSPIGVVTSSEGAFVYEPLLDQFARMASVPGIGEGVIQAIDVASLAPKYRERAEHVSACDAGVSGAHLEIAAGIQGIGLAGAVGGWSRPNAVIDIGRELGDPYPTYFTLNGLPRGSSLSGRVVALAGGVEAVRSAIESRRSWGSVTNRRLPADIFEAISEFSAAAEGTSLETIIVAGAVEGWTPGTYRRSHKGWEPLGPLPPSWVWPQKGIGGAPLHVLVCAGGNADGVRLARVLAGQSLYAMLLSSWAGLGVSGRLFLPSGFTVFGSDYPAQLGLALTWEAA